MPVLTELVLVISLAGCGGNLADQGIDLYHNLEGGPIAAQRPPPPGVDDPYPKIGTTPVRPLAADVAAQQRIADTLAAQRDAAGAAAAQDPLTVRTAPPPPPKPAPADPNGNKVVVAAAPAPAAAPPEPSPADVTAPGLGSVPALPEAIQSGPLPALALAPPPAPAGLGIDTPLPPPTPAVVAEQPAAPLNGVAVAFTPGSATLPPSATLRLRRLVLAHRGAVVAVLGRGDGGARDIDAKARALDLALRRAAAIAASLSAAGVQPAKLTIRAEAAGIGSTAIIN